jgi:hypothetical protein
MNIGESNHDPRRPASAYMDTNENKYPRKPRPAWAIQGFLSANFGLD